MICKKCGAVANDNARFCPKCGSNMESSTGKDALKPEYNHNLSSVWPEWQLETLLGKGAYGTVYKAVRRDNNIEICSAIKIISIPSSRSEVNSLRAEGYTEQRTRDYFKNVVDEFVGEVQLMESLKGVQNIVSVEDYKVVEKVDEIGWTIYIRMELLTSFNDFLCDRTLTEEKVIKIGVDICSALELCQRCNIIHRDIKPENIFVNSFGFFKLGDFGVARSLENSTGGMSQKGTFNYMAPEVAKGTHYDARVDIYSLGIVLYRLLNQNRLPFLTEEKLLSPRERKLAVERRISGEQLPPPCNASPQMADIILRACAYNPDDRFASASEMKAALIDALNNRYVISVDDVDKTVSGVSDIVTDASMQKPETEGAVSEINETVSVKKALSREEKTPQKEEIVISSENGKDDPPVVENNKNNKKRGKGRRWWLYVIIAILIIGILENIIEKFL